MSGVTASDITTIAGDAAHGHGKFALVVGRWHSFVVDNLRDGAIDTLHRHGVTDDCIQVVYAPGAFEIPLVCRELAESGDYDAIIALGAIIRGDTPHFEYIAKSCVNGLSRVMYEYRRPVAFGVLTADTVEQAVERAGGRGGDGDNNKAAMAITIRAPRRPSRPWKWSAC